MSTDRYTPGRDRSSLNNGSAFSRRVAERTSAFAAIWKSLDASQFETGCRYTSVEQRQHETTVRSRLRESREAGASGLNPRRRVGSVICSVSASMSPSHRPEAETMLAGFSTAGEEFVDEAGRFDSSLSCEEIYQALRNLWIVNSIQAAFRVPVAMTAPALAYSLLYPYTDNLLDSPDTTLVQKSAFVSSLRLRLAGKSHTVPSPHGTKISSLIARIESVYPRQRYPGVYESLLAIHDAQVRSIDQQTGYHGADEVLDISLEKGGTSVLADAYLVLGHAAPAQEQFAFGYGVILQIIDDLQDLEEDLAAGHATLCTLSAEGGTLASVVSRLLHSIRRVVADATGGDVRLCAALAELIERSCSCMVLESIARYGDRFTPEYVAQAERQSPVRFGFIRELRAEAGRSGMPGRGMLSRMYRAIPA